jgi:hypothetical protein
MLHQMICPECSAEMELVEGEDEKSDGRLVPYSYYNCGCGRVIYDYEDEFEWLEE